jgi:hypothetical protein
MGNQPCPGPSLLPNHSRQEVAVEEKMDVLYEKAFCRLSQYAAALSVLALNHQVMLVKHIFGFSKAE